MLDFRKLFYPDVILKAWNHRMKYPELPFDIAWSEKKGEKFKFAPRFSDDSPVTVLSQFECQGKFYMIYEKEESIKVEQKDPIKRIEPI